MKPGDCILSLAGVAGGVSLLLASAGMTIAVIGAARPPVSEYFTAAQNAHEAVRVSWLWIVPALSLLSGVWALGQVVLRRPLLTSEATARRWEVSNGRIACALICSGAAAVALLISMKYAILSIQAAGARPITDSMSFSGMSIGLGGIAGTCAVVSSVLFLRWWQDRQGAAVEPLGGVAARVV